MTYQPKVELSTRQIIFKPGDSQDFSRDGGILAPDLAVTVTNTTQSFISFHMELDAEGQSTQNVVHWYEVEPNVCAKKPPGDHTTFSVKVLRAPVPAYDTTIPLKVKVFSAELASVSAVETVYLKILRPAKTLRLFFPFQDLQVYPGARLKIPVLVYNLNPQLREITLHLEGVDPAWFPEGTEKTEWVDAGSSREVEFWCAPPAVATTKHETYRLKVQAIDTERNSASVDGHFQMLPFGRLNHQVVDLEKVVPDQLLPLTAVKGYGVMYGWQVKNDSNVTQTISLVARSESLAPGIECFAEPLTLPPAEVGQTSFQVQAKRPWLGWMRTHFIEATPELYYPDSDQPIPEVTAAPASQLLTLKVKPRIPLALQLLAGAMGGLLLWWLWFLSPRPLHQGSVNSVRLMGNGQLVISASSDQTLRQWQVNRSPWLPDVRRLKSLDKLDDPAHKFDQAIRVAELLPGNFRQVAVGLDNGAIQISDVDPPVTSEPLADTEQLDRIFDMAFTHDSRYLFSGHGSGTVRLWGFRQGEWRLEEDTKLYWGLPPDLSFAIASLAVSSDDRFLAVVGQFNRLLLWDWQSSLGEGQAARKPVAYDIPYGYLQPRVQELESPAEYQIPPVTSSNSYLTSVDFASKNPNIMVTADNVGFITVWDLQRLRDCMALAQPNPLLPEDKLGTRLMVIPPRICPTETMIVSQWQAGHQGSAIREVALDDTGCYLASTGDDGHISVWPLQENQFRENPRRARITVANFPNHPLNSVDLHRGRGNVLLIAADTPGYRVQLYRKQVANHGCQ